MHNKHRRLLRHPENSHYIQFHGYTHNTYLLGEFSWPHFSCCRLGWTYFVIHLVPKHLPLLTQSNYLKWANNVYITQRTSTPNLVRRYKVINAVFQQLRVNCVIKCLTTLQTMINKYIKRFDINTTPTSLPTYGKILLKLFGIAVPKRK